MKKEKITAILNFAAAFCCYVSAILSFIDENNTMAVMYLPLGSLWLSLACSSLTKLKDGNDEKKDR